MKVEVAVLGSTSLIVIVFTVSVDVFQHRTRTPAALLSRSLSGQQTTGSDEAGKGRPQFGGIRLVKLV